MYYNFKELRDLQALIDVGKVSDAGGLDVDVTEFRYWKRSGGTVSLVIVPAVAGLTNTDNSTNIVFVDHVTDTIGTTSGVLTAEKLPLAEVTTVAGDITSIVDLRGYLSMPWDTGKILLGGKGELVAHDGVMEVPFPVGAPGAVLTADPVSPTGFSWDPCPPPGPHSLTHISTGIDPIPLASLAASGLLIPTLGDATLFLDSTHGWTVPPTVTGADPGYVPAHPADARQVFLGDGTYGLPPDLAAMKAISGVADTGAPLRIDWTIVLNESGFTEPVVGEIEVPQAGLYEVTLSVVKVTPGVGLTYTIEMGGVAQAATSDSTTNSGVAMSTSTLVRVATPASQRIRVINSTGISGHSGSTLENVLVIKQLKD